MTGEQGDAVHNLVEEAIGDSHAAIGGDVEPHLVEVGLGKLRQTDMFHRAVLRFEAFTAATRFRPRAFTRAASVDRDGRSCAVYSPRAA